MPVFRVEKDTNYTTMCNCHLRDKRLSLKAKGLLSLFLSLPDEWHYSVRGIAAICKEGVDSIGSALRELEKYGYLVRNVRRGPGGRMDGTEYVIYERPRMGQPRTEKPDAALPEAEEPLGDGPRAENALQISKERASKEITSTKPNNQREELARKSYGPYGNVLLSDEELKFLRKEFPDDLSERIGYLSEYMAYSGKHYRNCLAVIRSFARRDREEKRAEYGRKYYSYAEGESL